MRKEVKASKKFLFVWEEELIFPCAFDAFLFNDPPHLALQPSTNKYSYYLIKRHDEIIHARSTFFIEDGVAFSPYKSSFGSIEFSTKVFFELLNEFWNNVEEDLTKKGAREIVIKNYPTCYSPANAQTLSFLLSTKGFAIKTQELNFHIEVDHAHPFEKKVHENERKKLASALKKGYYASEEVNFDITEVHSFLDLSRKMKNYPTTMSASELAQVFKAFPDNFLLFTVSLEKKWAAICIAVIVNNAILYTFYGADDKAFYKDSPLVVLHEFLYHYSLEKGFKIIDLGIGSAQGVSNFGLIRFKEKLGGEPSVKFTFYKKMN